MDVATVDMPEHKIENADYRSALNAFRGFAALYVVFYHIRYDSQFDWFGVFPILRHGYLGVDFFFILSGLIISHNYLQRGREANKGFWFKFIWYRLARLFPVHFFVMIAMLVGAWIKSTSLSAQDIADWFGVTFMIRQWFLPQFYAWNGPAWSISAELFAYMLIFPIIVRIAPALRSKADALKLMAIGFSFLIMLVAMFGTVNAAHFAGPLIRVIGGFVLGCGLFLLLSHYQPGEIWDKRLRWAMLCAPITFFIAIQVNETDRRADLPLIIHMVLVIGCVYLAKGRLASFLSTRPLFWLGEISLALYLCHRPMMMVYAHCADRLGINIGFWGNILTIMLSIIIAHLLYRCVETPSRVYMRRWYKYWKSKTTLRYS